MCGPTRSAGRGSAPCWTRTPSLPRTTGPAAPTPRSPYTWPPTSKGAEGCPGCRTPVGTHGQAGAGLFSTERALLPTRPAGEGGWQAERTGRRTGPACPGGCAFGLAAHTVQGRSCEGSRQGTLGPQPARRLPSCRDSTCHHGKGSFQVLRGRRTMVSNSYPVNRERRGTGTTRAIPSRTAATCSSNSWSLEEKAHFAFLRRCNLTDTWECASPTGPPSLSSPDGHTGDRLGS